MCYSLTNHSVIQDTVYCCHIEDDACATLSNILAVVLDYCTKFAAEFMVISVQLCPVDAAGLLTHNHVACC